MFPGPRGPNSDPRRDSDWFDRLPAPSNYAAMTVLFFCLGWVSCLWAATLYVFTLSPLAVKSAGTDMIVIVAALAILGLTAVLWSEIANRFRGR